MRDSRKFLQSAIVDAVLYTVGVEPTRFKLTVPAGTMMEVVYEEDIKAPGVIKKVSVARGTIFLDGKFTSVEGVPSFVLSVPKK